jgi:hypothetical protein
MYIIIETNDSCDPSAFGTFSTEAKAQKKLIELKSKLTEWDYDAEVQFHITKLINNNNTVDNG